MTSPSEITPGSGQVAYEEWQRRFDGCVVEDWHRDLADSERSDWSGVASAVLAAAAPEVAEDDPATRLLALQLPPNDWQAATVRGYFVALLAPLWRDPESFNAKNAVHHDMVYAAMVRAGIVEGEFEDGGLDYVDDVAADMLILAAIAKLGEVTS
jgi:hypothetical protein